MKALRIGKSGIAVVMTIITVAITTVSAQTTYLSEAFPSANVADPMKWEAVAGPSGASSCLTARDGVSGLVSLYGGSLLSGCADRAIDGNNFGALRLTKSVADQVSLMQYVNPVSTANGFDITFKIAQYSPNGGRGGEGMVFFIKDASNSSNSTLFASGGLGYANTPSKPGVPGALLGIAFDRSGNFASGTFGSANCPAGSTIPNSIGVRGADASLSKDGSEGFCFLGGSAGVDYTGANRTEATRAVRIAVDPVGAADAKIRIFISGADLVMPSTPMVVVTLPAAYLGTGMVKFGFSAANTVDGGVQEVWDFKVTDAVADGSARTRYAGNGWFNGQQNSRSSFGFNFQEVTNKTSRGAMVWSLGENFKFESENISCRGNAGSGTCTARGELIQKLGDNWFTLGMQDMTFSFTRPDKNGRTNSASFSYSFPSIGLSDTGTVSGGTIKIIKM